MDPVPEIVDTDQVKQLNSIDASQPEEIKPAHSLSCRCSVMMAFCWQGVLLLTLAAAVSVYADMKLNCWPEFVTLVWTENRVQADPSLFRLGNCFPTSVTASEAVFNAYFNDCNFRMLVTGDRLIYTNDLTYDSSSGSDLQPLTQLVVCSFKRPKGWRPQMYDSVFNTYGLGQLVFQLSFMNDDFSGPAASTSFPLGSFIPLKASVEQEHHQPLLLLLEKCVASTTPELQPDSNLYPIVNNKGCLMDSKTSRSKFEPREETSEIRLSLQAFRFSLGEEVSIHCELGVWDPTSLDHSKKACHYVKYHGWELLDNPVKSNLCNCCDSSCNSRKTRSIEQRMPGQGRNVLPLLAITNVNS